LSEETIEVTFSKLGHFWLDAGLAGFIQLVEEIEPEAVVTRISRNQFILKGTAAAITDCLEKAYDSLIEGYYNLSTQKQRDDQAAYNFYYDSRNDQFVPFPKRKSVGIAGIIYNKAPRPVGYSIKWEREEERNILFNGKTIKKNRGILPESHRHLQERMDRFLDENGLNVTTSGLLVDGPNAVRPNVKIQVDQKKKKGTCYLCGEASEILDDANQTIFPFITGSSGVLSFNPGAGGPEKICWKCSFIGKFVPVTGFYYSQGDNLYSFLPYSASLGKMLDSFGLLQDARYVDPRLFRNFDPPLGGYFQHPFETAFAFLYTLYHKLKTHNQSAAEAVAIRNLEILLDQDFDLSALEFYIVHTRDEGNTFAGKLLWPFKETRYFFRLMQRIENGANLGIKEVLSLCIDFTAAKPEMQTLVRDKICERMLKKQPIIDLVERHVFHANVGFVKPLLDLAIEYQSLLREGDEMYREEQEAAVDLGRCVGKAVGKSANGKKGDLFALRKSRRMVDFLEQLNRLQFRLGNDFNVPPEVYEGKLTDKNFQEFKQFCMIAAVNSFNFYFKERKEAK
jgi:hypothetical protein